VSSSRQAVPKQGGGRLTKSRELNGSSHLACYICAVTDYTTTNGLLAGRVSGLGPHIVTAGYNSYTLTLYTGVVKNVVDPVSYGALQLGECGR
jgi:hypothetical protein